MCVLHLVPFDIYVVTTVVSRAGDLPASTVEQLYFAFLRPEAPKTDTLHHL